jgi:molecular chaperone HscB
MHAGDTARPATSTDTTLCSSCGKTAAAQLVCPGCGVVQQIDRDPDFFTVFSLPRRLTVDLEDLARRYYDLSRRLHPDLFHGRPPAEQAASLRATALLNRAYRTLRDPAQRALYWLSLHGETLGRDNERVPPALAALVFEVQERLEALRDARRGGDDAALADEVRAVHADLRSRLSEIEARLQEHFTRAGAHAGGASALAETKRILSELHYVRTLVRDTERELEPEWSAS